MAQTQPKPGHLRGVSKNPKRTSGTSLPEGAHGHNEYGRSANTTDRSGSVPEMGAEVRGTQLNAKARKVSTKDIGDGVVR